MNILRALILDDLIDFLDFWFYHSPKKIIRNFFDQIYFFDKNLKVTTNLRNFNKPLYGDYTFIGYLIAIPYRFIKIIFGFIFYLLIFLIYLAFILIWIFLPIFLLIYGFLF
jgi:hypothetical protein